MIKGNKEKGCAIGETNKSRQTVNNFKSQASSYKKLNVQLLAEIEKCEKLETEVRNSEERYRLLYERSPLGYQSLDANGNFLEVNPAWLKLLGYGCDEVFGKWFGDFIIPEQLDLFKEKFPCFKATGHIYGAEFTMLRKDQTTVEVEFDGKIGYDKDGSFKQTHCIMRNVTDRKQAEEALRKSQEKFQLTMSVTNDALWDWDIVTNEVWRNDSHATMLGYEPHELTASQDEWEIRVHPDDRERVFDALNEHLSMKSDYFEVEYRLKAKSGKYIWVLGRGSVVTFSDDGSPIRMVNSLRSLLFLSA